MGTRFFIDESGHSGDAVNSGSAYDFLDQPYFVLAALGIEDETALVQHVEELKATHRMPTGELKAKSVLSRPSFVADLLTYVSDAHLPYFVEIVDKRYFICAHLVNYQLLPAVLGYTADATTYVARNQLADFLYDEISNHVLDRFVEACLEPSDHTLMSAFGSQLLFSAGKSTSPELQSIRNCMHQTVVDSARQYGEMRKEMPDAYLRFLPPPDLNKRNKRVWMLPNLTSLTNIYARINLFCNGRLEGVRLIHDQQLELDDILCNAKCSTESIKDEGINPFTPNADYLFTESVPLDFALSHEIVGIQVADVIAGTFMRFFRDQMRGTASVAPEIRKSLGPLLRNANLPGCVGVNQVVPTRFVL